MDIIAIICFAVMCSLYASLFLARARALKAALQLRNELDDVRRIYALEKTELDRLISNKKILDEAKEYSRVVREEAEKQRKENDNFAAQSLAEISLKREASKVEESLLSKHLQSLRNQIDGYGIEYISQIDKLFEDLSDDFSFEDAGKELKAARAASRRIVKDGKSATSLLRNKAHRQDAIRFLTESFDERVGVVIWDARKENPGILEQKIVDVFNSLNYYGSNLEIGSIDSGYLDAKVQEMRWAVIAFILKDKLKEEQRELRAQEREDALVEKEQEQQRKAAAREEETKSRAILELQKEMLKASVEQQENYERRIFQLTAERDAARDAKASISLAQQTKKGYVYIISNEGSFGKGVYKIGQTRRLDPQERIDELGDASVPFQFDIHAVLQAEDAPALESALHKEFMAFRVNKVNLRKEFFRIDLEKIRQKCVEKEVAGAWTLMAQAREYKETLAREHQLQSDPESYKEWVSKKKKEYDRVIAEVR